MVPSPSAETLTLIVQRLVDALHPEQIILFGSRAWGTPRQDSDFDLFLIMPGETKITLDLQAEAYAALFDLGISKDIVLSNRAHVEKTAHIRGSLTYRVLYQGKIIYG
ncbi:nucleotidyltransferase domain-containing protein [Gloeobacter violaceus]|uniref:Gll2293 protein n=1 Tax=Gloeobacter violaceus (strain ATCC 29082 / PCC 7421) TaxID=251221 RepID=Q7NI90_GLOVI|nr:nucleotidyltransferase domain-containing protein [Gloeobacter violaceus]BAC90234.1 gll2293 [Gloeobacter violaceus PCC 7421]